MDWPARQKICVGIARGLAFLHEESILKFVHKDIKSTNILLDGDLNPKISDFGLAKLYEERIPISALELLEPCELPSFLLLSIYYLLSFFPILFYFITSANLDYEFM